MGMVRATAYPSRYADEVLMDDFGPDFPEV